MELSTAPITYLFNNVTLLVTHYNRSSSFERLMQTFRKLNVTFGDIVVSDDGSKPEHLQKLISLQQEYNYRLITTPINRGLSNNINKGQTAVTTPYTLYIQEDFVPNPIFPAKLADSLAIMEEQPEIDLARYWAYFKYPYLKPIRNGFSEAKFSIWKPGYRKFYMYSDACHLRRSNFIERFGRYPEIYVDSDKAEYLMMMYFLRKKGRMIFYENPQELLEHINDADEPSTVKRDFLASTQNHITSNIRHLYRHVKFNIDYFFLLSRFIGAKRKDIAL